MGVGTPGNTIRADMATSERARPVQGEAREQQVKTIFSEIAPRYDLLNHVLSLNVDRAWRRRAIGNLGWESYPGGLFLDACAGTYDLSLELAKRPGFRGRVIASDFARPMLVQGMDKLGGAPVFPVCGDTLKLPFRDGTFHGAMVAFGIRNLSDLPGGLREFARVLRPGGRLVVLEFAEPPNPALKRLYLFYFRRVLPVVGRVVSGHPWAYDYLPASVRAFPPPLALQEAIEDAGFRGAHHQLLTGGIAALHFGVR